MKKFYLLLSALLVLVSCETEVDIDPPAYKSKIVVNSLLNTDEPVEVYVGFSVVALSKQVPNSLPDAVTELFENGVSQGAGVFDPIDQVYRWTTVPQAGNTYRIQISHPDYPTVNETLQMPASGNLGGIVYTDSVGLDTSGNKLAELRIRFNDPGTEKNYYRLYIAYYFDLGQEFLPFPFLNSDPILESPSTEKEGSGAYLFDDALFNGQSREIVLNFSPGIAAGTPRFLIECHSLSEDQYKYQLSLARYNNNDQNGPFSTPVFIHSNIDVGLGIFAGGIIRRDTIQ